MIVRDACSDDSPEVERIHRDMAMDYAFPDLQNPLFVVGKCVYEDGRLKGACYLRLTAECYLWLDPAATPREKVNAMNLMQPEVLASARNLGLDEINACIPAAVEKKFLKRLLLLGWDKWRDNWSGWTRSTRE
jgi:hypothetical protein